MNRFSTVAPFASFLLTVSGLAQDEVAQTNPGTDSVNVSNLWTDLEEAFQEGDFWLSFRYRLENVGDDASPKDAHASTVRTVLGFETADHAGFRALIEVEDVSPLGNDLYNSTINGVLDRPMVPDPNGSELNRLQISYQHSDALGGTYGRQQISHDDQRFIGPVGWRQNFQTFDAFTIGGQVGDVDLSLGHIRNVNRVFGDASGMGNAAMDSQFAHAATEVAGLGHLTAYAYLLDYDTATVLSTNTFGLRYSGKSEDESVPVDWLFEYATQTDTGRNPNAVDQDYAHARLGADVGSIHVSFDYELLGGSGVSGDKFTTPLATRHAFNGWADKFLTTPDTGLEDMAVSLSGAAGKAQWRAVYHQFAADAGGSDYGSEVDLLATYPVTQSLTVGVKYAAYDADTFSTNATKAWAWFSWDVPLP